MKRNKKNDTNGLHVLANDPSIRAWGYVVLDSKGRILTAGCIKTESEAKKRRIRKGDDDVRRVHEINKVLLDLIHQYKINYMVSELPHGSKSASSAKMIGVVTGINQTLSDTLDIGIEWYLESDAKKELLGTRAATKGEVQDMIMNIYPEVPWTGVQYADEAIADAMAIYHVARRTSNVLKYGASQT